MNNRIKEFRAKFELTQDDLARKVNVRRETIVFLEKGKYNPSLKLAHDIAAIFNVTIEEVGNASAFLCSDLASGITGEITYVDGGMNITAAGVID